MILNIILIYLLIIAYPICYSIFLSFTNYNPNSDTPAKFVGLANYIKVMTMNKGLVDASNNVPEFWHAFKNNMIVSFKNMLLGALSFGLFSIIYTFYNGFCFGLVSGASSHVLSLSEILGSTLPHSFEFIGIVLYGNIGFLISVYAFTHKQILTKKTLLWMFIIATMIILFAAIIENYVSMSN